MQKEAIPCHSFPEFAACNDLSGAAASATPAARGREVRMSSFKKQSQLAKMDQTNLKAYLGNVSGRIDAETSFTLFFSLLSRSTDIDFWRAHMNSYSCGRWHQPFTRSTAARFHVQLPPWLKARPETRADPN